MSRCNEATVEERDQRNDGRESAACVETLIDRVAALLQGEQTDVGILDGQQLQNALTQGVIVLAEEFTAQSFTPDGGVCRIFHGSLFAGYLPTQPPSTYSDWPVTYFASSEAKNAATVPISRG